MTFLQNPEALRAENEARHPVQHVGMPRSESSMALALRMLRRRRAGDRGARRL